MVPPPFLLNGHLQVSRNLEIRMQSALITGGVGFIDQYLVHAWRAACPNARLASRLQSYPAGARFCRSLIGYVTDCHRHAIDASKLAIALISRGGIDSASEYPSGPSTGIWIMRNAGARSPAECTRRGWKAIAVFEPGSDFPMRILVLNSDYPRFLSWFYRRQPGLEHASYDAQMAVRNASLFGVADFYSRNFSALGHAAAEIHVNNPYLQSAWAREHGIAVRTSKALDIGERLALPTWLRHNQTVQALAEAARPQNWT